jgi:hypothetical protein
MTRRNFLRLGALERRLAPAETTIVYVIHRIEPFETDELVYVVDIAAGTGTRRAPTDAERLTFAAHRAARQATRGFADFSAKTPDDRTPSLPSSPPRS